MSENGAAPPVGICNGRAMKKHHEHPEVETGKRQQGQTHEPHHDVGEAVLKRSAKYSEHVANGNGRPHLGDFELERVGQHRSNEAVDGVAGDQVELS